MAKDDEVKVETKGSDAGEGDKSFLSQIGFSESDWNKYKSHIAKAESGGKYDTPPNAGGYAGRYQMGKEEIKESAKRLGIKPPSEEEFLKDHELQDKLFQSYVLGHHEQLLADPSYAKASPEERAGMLAGAHLGGIGGLHSLERGIDVADANGTRVSSYINSMREAMGLDPVPFKITRTTLPGGSFANKGIDFEQDRDSSQVRYMDPSEFLALLPPITDEPGEKSKRKALMDSLMSGEDIEAIPSLEMGKKGKVVDYDGRHRAQAARDAGITAMPVAFHGPNEDEEPKNIQGLTQASMPFNFEEVPKSSGRDFSLQSLLGISSAEAAEMPQLPPGAASAQLPPKEATKSGAQTALDLWHQASPAPTPPFAQPMAESKPESSPMEMWRQAAPQPVEDNSKPGFWQREGQQVKSFLETPAQVAAGVARPIVGLARLGAEAGSAVGFPGAETAASGIGAAQNAMESLIQSTPEGPFAAGAGEIGGLIAAPQLAAAKIPGLASALSSIPTAAKAVAQPLIGAATGAVQPTSPENGEYWPQTGQNALIGGVAGMAGPALKGAGVLANHLVSPGTFTRAANRLIGSDAYKATENAISDAYNHVKSVLQPIEKSIVAPLSGKLENALNNISSEARKKLLTRESRNISTIVKDIKRHSSASINETHIDNLLKPGGALENLVTSSDPRSVAYGKNLGSMMQQFKKTARNGQAPIGKRIEDDLDQIVADATVEGIPAAHLKDVKSIVKGINKNILREMPGDEIANMLRIGAPLDKLARNPNENISRYARRVESNLKNSLTKQMTPAERDLYKEAKRKENALAMLRASRDVGESNVQPDVYAGAARGLFRDEDRIPAGTAPPELRLARAAGKLWGESGEGLSRIAKEFAGVGGAGLGHMVGHPFFGWASARMAAGRLLGLRYAQKNELKEIAPWRTGQNNMANRLAPKIAAPLAAGVTMPTGQGQ